MDLSSNLSAMLERTRENVAAGRRATRVTFYIELPADQLGPEEIWPSGGPGDEGWDANSVVSELVVQYGDTIPLRRLAEDWGIGDQGGELIITDDAGNIARIGLRS
jgi:hypothetical protein